MSEDVPGKSDRSVGSDRSDRSGGTERRHALRPSGGYRALRSFQVTTIIYDATVAFCGRFLDSRSRTVDQMVQAARSGRQNIAEGSRASATSSQTELRLVNVARASLDELLLDYEDFLRQRGLPRWEKDDSRARQVRDVANAKTGNRTDRSDRTDQSDPADGAEYAGWLNQADPAIPANAVICLIHQANYLLDRQIAGLERSFIREGGYSENLAAARRLERQNQAQPDAANLITMARESDTDTPACPTCGGPMIARTAHHGKNAGSRFWGCRGYPECRGTRPLQPATEGRKSDGSVRSARSVRSD